MKYILTILFGLTSILTIGQRGEISTSNPDNSLKLETVFQNYTRTTRHGAARSVEKLKYLNLKVNDMYFKDGYTGISEENFEKYLSACPPALDLSLDGLDHYKKAGSYNRLGNTIGFSALFAAGYLLFKGVNNNDRKWWVAAGSTFGAGAIARYTIGRKSKSETTKGHEKIIDAFDLYAENCYQPVEKEVGTTGEDLEEEDQIRNGESNDKEKVRINNITSNLNSLLWSLGPSIGIGYSDIFAANAGGSMTIFKNGFYLNVNAERTFDLSSDLFDPENAGTNYGYTGLLSIPFLNRESKSETLVSLGQMQGLNSYGKVNFLNKWNLGIDAGIEYNQNTWEDYYVNQTFIRTGLGYTIFSNHTYNIDDNRFKDEQRMVTYLGRAYVHALYSLNRDWKISCRKFHQGFWG